MLVLHRERNEKLNQVGTMEDPLRFLEAQNGDTNPLIWDFLVPVPDVNVLNM